MLAERAREWTKQWWEGGLQEGKAEGRAEGRQEGRAEGRQEGRQEGEAAILLHLLERKYGPAAAAAYRERVTRADAHRLLAWSERLLTAETIDEIFDGD